MKKMVIWIKILILIFLFCFILGFYITTLSTDTVFIGIGIIVISAVIGFIALILSLKIIHLQNKQTENRIKKLEDEVELLKKINI